jgi:pimeloyl-ACP methyl ester carboxylesterase
VGETVIYEAPKTPQKVTFTIAVSDSGAQFVDLPQFITFSVDVRKHPVMIVPGLLASALELNRGDANKVDDWNLIWPPIRYDAGFYFSRNWPYLILNEDGTDTQSVRASAMIDDAELYGDDYYGVLRGVLATAGHDTYGVPYDWRKALAKSALALDRRVQDALQGTKFPKVSIVCHSMGGLVSREWISHRDGGSKVDQIVFVATPHHGAPKAYRYLKWGAGIRLSTEDWGTWIVTRLSLQDSVSLFTNWPSFYHLLPTKEFFTGEGAGFFEDQHEPDRAGRLDSRGRTYTYNSDAQLSNQTLVKEAEEFHDALPQTLPDGIKRYNVYAGNLPTERYFTLYDRKVRPPTDTDLYSVGDDFVRVGYGLGDGTVPTPSARWSYGSPRWDHEYRVDGVIHSRLPNDLKTISYVLYWFENLN